MVVQVKYLPEKTQEEIVFTKTLIGIDMNDLENAIDENALDRINMYSIRLRKTCKKLTELYKVKRK